MPDNVRDRDELLLNAIVTGDTSGIDPRDREETFIKAIANKIAHLPVLTRVGSVRIKPTAATINANSGQTINGTFTITPVSGYSFPNNRIPITDILIFSSCINMDVTGLSLDDFIFNENSTYHTYQCVYTIANTTEAAITIANTLCNFVFDIYRLI